MCVVIKSRPEFKMGHVGSKTRSLGQFLEKPCVLSRRHSFDPVFMKLCQNDFLTLNKRLSRRAMLSDDSSCLASCREINRFSVSKIGPEPAKPTISLALIHVYTKCNNSA